MYLMMDANLELEKILSIFQERLIQGLKVKTDKPYRPEEK